ncbi:MAG: glycosyltransferase family 2 protein, partial [Desulfobacteraceae bacterium]|nr:glycosyltransferase family 2 protein [Desulfobacteraceae bacterium]
MDGADPCFTVVLPVYREAENLKECISSICAQLGDLGSFEILAVDDGSPDNSWQVITQLSEDNPLVRGIRFSRNFGKESAISAGLAHARGQAVVIMDADLQHPPELLPQMIRLWRDDKYDVVDAVKVARGKESKLRRLMAALFTRLMCRLTGFNLAGSSDFKLLDRRAVRAWLQLDERLTFYRGMTEWIGFRHTQVPFEVKERAGGATSWSYCELLSLGSNAIVSFSS